MALAERATLITELRLDNKLSPGLAKAGGSLRSFDKITQKTRVGLANLSVNLLKLGAAATVSAVAFLGVAVKEGQAAQKVQLIYAKAIENSAKSAGALKATLADLTKAQGAAKPDSKAYAALAAKIALVKGQMSVFGPVTVEATAALNAQQITLMNLAGVDDELIKTEQTRLIQMGLSGKSVLRLTPLIMDLSKATGRDLLTSTIAIGKAVNGNVAGLLRFGIVVDKEKAKLDPFGAVLDALTKKFGGTTKAMSGEFETRLGALRANLGNITEDIGIKLLPALTRITDTVATSLVPAFGKFIDRILPDISRGMDEFASALEDGGAEKAINGIADALGTVIDLLKVAAGPVKAIVNAFLGLPKELQTVLIGAFAVNKLSGGMVTGLIGEVGKGVVKGVLGMKAGVVNINAAVVNGAGGLPGAAAKGAGAAGALVAGLTAGAVIAVGAVALDQYGKVSDQSNALASQAAEFVKTATLEELRSGRQALIDGAKALADESRWNPLAAASFEGMQKALVVLDKAIAAGGAGPGPGSSGGGTWGRPGGLTAVAEVGSAGVMERAIAKGFKPSASGINATMARNAVVQATIDRVQSVTRAREAANAVSQSITNTNRIVSAILGINIPTPYTGIPWRQGENDRDPEPILPGGGARSKMTPSPGSGDFRLTVKTAVTARDVAVATQKRTAYNGSTTRSIGRAV